MKSSKTAKACIKWPAKTLYTMVLHVHTTYRVQFTLKIYAILNPERCPIIFHTSIQENQFMILNQTMCMLGAAIRLIRVIAPCKYLQKWGYLHALLIVLLMVIVTFVFTHAQQLNGRRRNFAFSPASELPFFPPYNVLHSVVVKYLKTVSIYLFNMFNAMLSKERGHVYKKNHRTVHGKPFKDCIT